MLVTSCTFLLPWRKIPYVFSWFFLVACWPELSILPTHKPITSVRLQWLAHFNHDSSTKSKHSQAWQTWDFLTRKKEWLWVNNDDVCWNKFISAVFLLLLQYSSPCSPSLGLPLLPLCVLVTQNFFKFPECSMCFWHPCLAVLYA